MRKADTTYESFFSEDLRKHRSRVANSLTEAGYGVIGMENFGAQPQAPAVASLEEIDACDAFVGIYAHRYGSIPSGSEKSFTEMELDYALKQKKEIFCFIADDSYPWLPKYIEHGPGRKKLSALKERLLGGLVTAPFRSPDNLASKVIASLSRYELKKAVIRTQAGMRESPIENRALEQVAQRAERMRAIIEGARVLLVNDVLEKWASLEALLQELKVEVVFVQSTEDALKELTSMKKYDAVVSDIIRGKDTKAGFKLLHAMREKHIIRPFIFTVTKYEPWRDTPAYAFGITNNVDDILNYLFDIFERERWQKYG